MSYPFATLPDLLEDGMMLVFVGINPSLYSVERGHYFARRTSRFWPAFSASRLSEPIRRALGTDLLGPDQDQAMLGFGIGFTDVVKVPSSNARQIPTGMYAEWAPRLVDRLAQYKPRLAVFHGVTGFRPFLEYGLGVARKPVELGLQPETIAGTRVFVVPNPSPANAHVTPVEQAAWYDRVADFLDV